MTGPFRDALLSLLALATLSVTGCSDSASAAAGSQGLLPPAPVADTEMSHPSVADPHILTNPYFPESSTLGMGPVATTVTLTGQVRFDGPVPPRKALAVLGDKTCEALYKDTPLLSEDLVVDPATRGVKNAFVYIRSGFGDRRFPVPNDAVAFTAIKCRFEPHVAGAMITQHFEVSMGSGECMHQTKVPDYSLCMSAQIGPVPHFCCAEPRMGVPIQCSLHSWMKAYICVVDNPYYAVTAEDGRFTIPDLPPGTYELAVWHEKLGAQTRTLTIEPGAKPIADFVLAQAH